MTGRLFVQVNPPTADEGEKQVESPQLPMLEWTDEQPTEGGLYWAYDGVDVVPIDVYITSDRIFACELGTNYGKLQDLSNWDFFMGPLPVPEPPGVESGPVLLGSVDIDNDIDSAQQIDLSLLRRVYGIDDKPLTP